VGIGSPIRTCATKSNPQAYPIQFDRIWPVGSVQQRQRSKNQSACADN
jgi:hypothetical protein